MKEERKGMTILESYCQNAIDDINSTINDLLDWLDQDEELDRGSVMSPRQKDQIKGLIVELINFL